MTNSRYLPEIGVVRRCHPWLPAELPPREAEDHDQSQCDNSGLPRPYSP